MMEEALVQEPPAGHWLEQRFHLFVGSHRSGAAPGLATGWR